MKNLKKLLSVIVVVAMLVTMMMPAFAEETAISAEAKICADLNVLRGDGNGVDAEYLAKSTTRLQAAIITLRLMGKEDEAKAYEGTDNFSDVDNVWSDGKAMLAYLKANPELGWQGNPDGSFNPDGEASAQMIYKVILEVLGYKQGTDFEWADVLTFAEGKDLSEVAEIDELTNDDLAVALIEGLKATNADGKTLAADLVAKEVITQEAAEAAELVPPAYTPVALDVKSVTAVTNAKVVIALNTAAVQADLDAATISAADADNKVLEIKSKTLSADGKSVMVVTAAQTAYAAYSLTVGDITKTFVGLPVDSSKPSTSNITVESYVSVKVTFSEKVDATTATNIANYVIDNNLSVLKAELDSTGTIVILTTSEQTVGTIYKITVQNVTDLSGNAMDKTEAYFGGMAKDTSNLAVSSANVTDYNQVTVVFNKAVDSATATNIANYVIDNNLSVIKAEVYAADTTGKTVVLTTLDQTVGTIYKLTIKNVTDKLSNGLAAAYETYFGGMAKDLSKPTATAAVTDNDKVTVSFDKKLDAATATNIANYTIDNNLVVLKAELNSDGKVVTLTTSAQTVGTIYKITVQNVASALGVAMDKTEAYFGGMAKDVTGPTIVSASSAANKLTVVFGEKVDAASATVLTNYAFDGGLGYPTSAVVNTTLDSTGKTVELTTAAQTAGKIYKVTITNVKDSNGNVISTADSANVKAFIGTAAAAASSVVKFQAASIVNYNTIDLIFDTELTATNIAGLTVEIDKITETTNPGLAYKAEIQSNKKVVRVQFKDTASTNPDLFKHGIVYKAKVTGVTNLDISSATDVNVKQYAGTNIANAIPEVKAVIPVDSTTVKVVFTEPVTGLTAGSFAIVPANAITGISCANTDVVSEVLVYFTTATTQGTVHKVQVQAGAFQDSVGYNNGKFVDSSNNNLEYQFAGTNVANAKPSIIAGIPVDMYNFDIAFSEAVNSNATTVAYTLYNVTDAQNVVLTGATYTLSDDGTKVHVTLKKSVAALAAGKVYKVTAPIGSTVTDLSGLAMDTTAAVEKQFAGTNVANAVPEIVAVTINSARTEIKVVFSEKIYGTPDATTIVLSASGYTAGTAYTSANLESDGKTVTITLGAALNPTQIASIAATAGIEDINGQSAKTTAVQFGIE